MSPFFIFQDHQTVVSLQNPEESQDKKHPKCFHPGRHGFKKQEELFHNSIWSSAPLVHRD